MLELTTLFLMMLHAFLAHKTFTPGNLPASKKDGPYISLQYRVYLPAVISVRHSFLWQCLVNESEQQC